MQSNQFKYISGPGYHSERTYKLGPDADIEKILDNDMNDMCKFLILLLPHNFLRKNVLRCITFCYAPAMLNTVNESVIGGATFEEQLKSEINVSDILDSVALDPVDVWSPDEEGEGAALLRKI